MFLKIKLISFDIGSGFSLSVGGYHHGYAAAAPVAHAVAAAPVIGGYGVSKVVTPYAAAAPAVYGGYAAHGMFSFCQFEDSYHRLHHRLQYGCSKTENLF